MQLNFSAFKECIDALVRNNPLAPLAYLREFSKLRGFLETLHQNTMDANGEARELTFSELFQLLKFIYSLDFYSNSRYSLRSSLASSREDMIETFILKALPFHLTDEQFIETLKRERPDFSDYGQLSVGYSVIKLERICEHIKEEDLLEFSHLKPMHLFDDCRYVISRRFGTAFPKDTSPKNTAEFRAYFLFKAQQAFLAFSQNSAYPIVNLRSFNLNEQEFKIFTQVLQLQTKIIVGEAIENNEFIEQLCGAIQNRPDYQYLLLSSFNRAYLDELMDNLTPDTILLSFIEKFLGFNQRDHQIKILNLLRCLQPTDGSNSFSQELFELLRETSSTAEAKIELAQLLLELHQLNILQSSRLDRDLLCIPNADKRIEFINTLLKLLTPAQISRAHSRRGQPFYIENGWMEFIISQGKQDDTASLSQFIVLLTDDDENFPEELSMPYCDRLFTLLEHPELKDILGRLFANENQFSMVQKIMMKLVADHLAKQSPEDFIQDYIQPLRAIFRLIETFDSVVADVVAEQVKRFSKRPTICTVVNNLEFLFIALKKVVDDHTSIFYAREQRTIPDARETFREAYAKERPELNDEDMIAELVENQYQVDYSLTTLLISMGLFNPVSENNEESKTLAR